ncbi:MAG: hypothetical protein ACRDJE_24780 [Dehalococcoidia bacterium]
MADAESSTLVFKDQAGEYYLLPQETLERGRVPAERKAEVEHLVAESHDVSGYNFGAVASLSLAAGFVVYCPSPPPPDPRAPRADRLAKGV